jgi:hypothetical protein
MLSISSRPPPPNRVALSAAGMNKVSAKASLSIGPYQTVSKSKPVLLSKVKKMVLPQQSSQLQGSQAESNSIVRASNKCFILQYEA